MNGDALLSCWQQELAGLKQRYYAAEFAALVAFIGMQNLLWPLWLRLCNQQGKELAASRQSRSLSDPQLHHSPWFCLLCPVEPQTAWGLVRAPGLADSSLVMSELMDPEIGMSLSTLHGSSPFIYGKTATTFTRWGVYRAVESSGPFIVSIKEEPATFDARGAKTSRFQIQLPFLNCEAVLADLPLWLKSLKTVESDLAELIDSLPSEGGEAVLSGFDTSMSLLWSQLQDAGIIECSPFAKEESGWRLGLRQSKKEMAFHGVFILLGDHQRLWRELQSLTLP